MGATSKKAIQDPRTVPAQQANTQANTQANAQAQAVRPIFLRTKGRTDGSLTRFVSPSDIGQSIKPFVLLDRFVLESQAALNFPLHPHSGIATLTALLDGSLHVVTSKGKQQTLMPGATEWMQAGRGAWHGGPASTARVLPGHPPLGAHAPGRAVPGPS